jgi:hypothetical protein
MPKPAKRRRARKAAKVRPQIPRPAATGSAEVPQEDLADRDVGQDAWLREREAEDIEREGR